MSIKNSFANFVRVIVAAFTFFFLGVLLVGAAGPGGQHCRPDQWECNNNQGQQASGVAQWDHYGSATWYGAPTPTISCAEAPGLWGGDSAGSGFQGSNSFSTSENPITEHSFSANGGVVYLSDQFSPDAPKLFVYAYATATGFYGLTPAIPATWVDALHCFHPGGLLCNGTLKGSQILVGGSGQGGATVLSGVGSWLNAGFPVGSSYGWICGSTTSAGANSTCYESALTTAADGSTITLATAIPAAWNGLLSAQPLVGGMATTVSGAPTGTASSYFYPTWTDHQGAEVFNGTTDYRDIGSSPSIAGAFSGCARFMASASGTQTLLSKYIAGAPNASALVFSGSGDFAFRVYNAAGNAWTITAAGSITTKTWNVACWSFNGTNTLRLNVNGAATTDIVTVVGPAAANSTHWVIGSLSDGSALWWSGGVSSVALFDGADKSDAQLFAMVLDQMSLETTKPVGNESFTGPASFCTPTSDQWGWWTPANVPCVGSSGIVLEPAHSNLITYPNPDATHWTTVTAVISGNSATCPLAPDGTQTMGLVTPTYANGNGAYYNATGVSRSAWAAIPPGDTACTIASAQVGADAQTVALTSTPARFWFTKAGANGIYTYTTAGAGSCTRWCIWGAQVNSSPIKDRFVLNGTTAADSLSVASTLTARKMGCIGIKATGDWTGDGGTIFNMGAALGASDSFRAYRALSGGGLSMIAYDDVGGSAYCFFYFPAGHTGTHTLVDCLNPNTGAMTELWDGVSRALTCSSGIGAFTSWATPITLLNDTANTSAFAGSVSRTCMGQDSKQVQKCLDAP